jgi:hypothetical protein
MATTIRARIYARGEVSFAKFLFFSKLVCQTVGGQFFLFCQNYIDAKLVCQTVGVALRHINFSNKFSEIGIAFHRT